MNHPLFTSLSDEQRAALTADATESVVIAAAGSGKTKLLIARLFWALLQETPRASGGPGEIIALTFTERAAEEMSARARAAALTLTAPQQRAFRERVRISTLHSYCAALIQQYPFHPLCEPCQGAPLGEHFFRLFIQEQAPLAAQQLGSQLHEGLSHRLLIASVNALAGHLRMQSGDLFENLARSAGTLRLQTLQRIEAHIACLRSLAPAAIAQSLPQSALGSPSTGETADPRPALQALMTLLHGKRLGSEACNEARSELRTLVTLSETLWSPPEPQRLAAMQQLIAITRHVMQAYQDFKRAHGAFDYGDLEQRALTLLSDDAVRQDASGRLAHVLIDEVQDTNPMQEALLERLASGGARLFRVGDPRQAIYGFRHADSAHMYSIIARSGARHELTRNYRSRQPILDLANRLWSAVGPPETQLGEMRSPLPLTGEEPAPHLQAIPKAEKSALSSAPSPLAQELTFIAEQVKKALHERPQESVAILCRTTQQTLLADHALRAAGIEARLMSRATLAEHPAFEEAHLILRALERPHDPFRQLEALRTTGATGAEIFALAAALSSSESPPSPTQHPYSTRTLTALKALKEPTSGSHAQKLTDYVIKIETTQEHPPQNERNESTLKSEWRSKSARTHAKSDSEEGNPGGGMSASGSGNISASAGRNPGGGMSASGGENISASAGGNPGGGMSASGSGNTSASAGGNPGGGMSASGSGNISASAGRNPGGGMNASGGGNISASVNANASASVNEQEQEPSGTTPSESASERTRDSEPGAAPSRSMLLHFWPIIQALHSIAPLGFTLEESFSYLAGLPLPSLHDAPVASESPEAAVSKPQILTIHGAKGLEWDTVLLPFLHRRFTRTQPPDLYAVPRVGALIQGPWPKDAYTTTLHTLMTERELAEEHRLLYVAITRPKTHLLLSGAIKSATPKSSTVKNHSNPLSLLLELN